MKKIFIFVIVLVLIVVASIGGYFGARYYLSKNFTQDYFFMHPTIAKIFRLAPAGIFYRNSGYGFEMTFPKTWRGFIVQEKNWQGWTINGSEKTYFGPEILIKNPQSTPRQAYQDIPIMIFTHDVWNMVGKEQSATVAVSAAPIGPAKIGENSKYVFATPPRWYGFTDAIGWQEAIDILKTFKAF